MTVQAAPPPEPWTPARLAALDRIQRLRRETADRTDRLAALIVAVLPLACYALAAGIESDRRRYGRHTTDRRAEGMAAHTSDDAE